MKPPSPRTISLSGFQQALTLYPTLVEKVYHSKLKDAKKISDALARDEWRFEQLPALAAGAKTESIKGNQKSKADLKSGRLTKETVERLVQWKITHGHSRPFLPAMIRKNEPVAVEARTSQAFKEISTSSSRTSVASALGAVSKLTGIGPATGTLILNVFDPINIPFFQDEMFEWFFPEAKGSKLKYNEKEYFQLFDAVGPVLDRLKVRAVDLEKVSYVLGHLELLDEVEQRNLEAACDEQNVNKNKIERITQKSSSSQEDSLKDPTIKKGTKRSLNIAESIAQEPQQSKRRSQRGR